MVHGEGGLLFDFSPFFEKNLLTCVLVVCVLARHESSRHDGMEGKSRARVAGSPCAWRWSQFLGVKCCDPKLTQLNFALCSWGEEA